MLERFRYDVRALFADLLITLWPRDRTSLDLASRLIGRMVPLAEKLDKMERTSSYKATVRDLASRWSDALRYYLAA